MCVRAFVCFLWAPFYLTPSYCSSLSSSAAHYEKPVLVCANLKRDTLRGMEREKVGVGDVEGRGEKGGKRTELGHYNKLIDF